MPADTDDHDSDLDALIEALRDRGINVPPEVSDLRGLVIAVKASGPVTDTDDEDIAGAASGSDATVPG